MSVKVFCTFRMFFFFCIMFDFEGMFGFSFFCKLTMIASIGCMYVWELYMCRLEVIFPSWSQCFFCSLFVQNDNNDTWNSACLIPLANLTLSVPFQYEQWLNVLNADQLVLWYAILARPQKFVYRSVLFYHICTVFLYISSSLGTNRVEIILIHSVNVSTAADRSRQIFYKLECPSVTHVTKLNSLNPY